MMYVFTRDIEMRGLVGLVSEHSWHSFFIIGVNLQMLNYLRKKREGDLMGQTGNETKHNARDFKIRWNVIVIPVVLFLIILIAGIAIPDTFNAIVNKGVMLIMKDMGWFISLSTLFFL